MLKVAVIIPTFNGGNRFKELLVSLDAQQDIFFEKLVIDSSSTDCTAKLADVFGYKCALIALTEFNHGGTRQQGIHMVDADFIVFLTQDVILANPFALANLVNCFQNPLVGAAYGRQLPHQGAKPAEAHARLFNYPAHSRIKSQADVPVLGMKTAFLSNSFAAYRRSALLDAGGFPHNTILGEDMYVAANMLLKGWQIAYCAEALAYHSHSYTLLEEFRRYFDIGVFQSRERWIQEQFGKAEGEGLRYLQSEFLYLWRMKKWDIPEAMLRTLLKYAGYKLGFMERKIPSKIKGCLSMHQRYWLR